jgi:hypothetical protein
VRAALSASTPELISILGGTVSKARLWNRYQSVNSQRQWNVTLWYFDGPQYLARQHFPQENKEWGHCGAEISNCSSRISPRVSRLKGSKLHYSKPDV